MNPACTLESTSTGLGSCIQMRRLVLPVIALVVVGIVVLGLTQTGGQKKTPDRLTLDLLICQPSLADSILAGVRRLGLP